MLQDYFNSLTDKIAADATLGGVSSHRPDIGLNREHALLDVLNRHIPDCLHALPGGVVLAIDGAPSKQIDIIVRSDKTPRFEEQSRGFVHVESLVAAISVKSTLDRRDLFDSLDNLGSIPQMAPGAIDMSLLRAGAVDDFQRKHPTTYIYAFNGYSSPQNCLQSLAEYFKKRPGFPENRIPREIVVNGKFMLSYQRVEGRTIDGTKIPAKSFWPISLDSANRGIALARIINGMFAYVNWMPYLNVNFHMHVNRAYNMENIS